ncbi:hypothetical protein D3C75_835460 [compost metagenome]
MLTGSPGHCLDHLATHGANRVEQRLRDTELQGFLPIGVGDVTGLEPLRAAGNPRDRLGDTAAGAGLGRGDLHPPAQQRLAKLSGKPGDRVHRCLRG